MIHPPPKCISVAEINLPISRAEKKKGAIQKSLKSREREGRKNDLKNFLFSFAAFLKWNRYFYPVTVLVKETEEKEGMLRKPLPLI